MKVDWERAYEAYLGRFTERFGEKAEGAFGKFGKHMVQKLDRGQFETRLSQYLKMHEASKKMLAEGSTINDAVVLEFDEAAAWIAIQVPDMMRMFSGEIGDPDIATGKKPSP